MESTIFISYSSKDSAEVQEIVSFFESEKIAYFKAPEMIPVGSNYAREIPRAIQACSIFLLIISAHSQNSMWVEKELDCAINNRKTIVPVQISSYPLNETFRFYLNNVQILSYWDEPKDALFHLSRRIRNIMSTQLAEKDREYTNHQEQVVRESARRSNALSENQIPVECDACGGMLEQIYRGTYRCRICGQLHYDSYQTVRNYLSITGPRSITQISEATGVSRKAIEFFLRDERLEIPSQSDVFLICEGCGAMIRSGCLCDSCKDRGVKPKNAENGINRYCIGSK